MIGIEHLKNTMQVMKEEQAYWVRGTLRGTMYYYYKTAVEALQEKLERENPHPLGLVELGKIELLGWVWIEITDEMEIGKSGYYQKNSDWSDGERFCCGYPGTMYGFRYCDYGKKWLAYRYEPKHIGEANEMLGTQQPEWKNRMMGNFTKNH